MKRILICLVTILSCLSSCSQNGSKVIVVNKPEATDLKVGGNCEGCEAVYESKVAFEKLPAIDTLPGFNDDGPKIEINGTIYKADGITPAAEVILYVYHTDQNGKYSGGSDESVWSKRHGIRRGWIRTDNEGRYRFYTLIPASYPNSTIVKHIHPIIKEPGKTAYWIDDFLFADDPFLTERDKNKKNPAGGSGILTPEKKNGILTATRDIILGQNVPGYPKE